MDHGLAVVAVFAYLSWTVWVESRKEERHWLQRQELYRKILEQPSGGTEAVRVLLEEEAIRRREESIAGMKLGGMITVAVGISLAVFLYYILPGRSAYLVGLVPLSVGMVLLFHAFVVAPRPDRTGRR